MHLFCDRPDEANQLARDCGGDYGRQLSFAGKLAIPPAQSFLCLPCDVADWFGQALLPQQLLSTDPRRETVAPGGLNQHPPRCAVPGLGNPTLTPRVAAGMLGRNQAEIRHELARSE